MEEDDEEDMEILNMVYTSNENEEKSKTVYGRGNAIKGYRNAYKLYPSSDVFTRVKFAVVCSKNRYQK